VTRRLILEDDREFLLPVHALRETEKHRVTLCRRTGLSHAEFVRILETLLAALRIVPDETTFPFREAALAIVRDIDPDDEQFIACCLAFPGSVLWSDDKALQQQDAVRIVTTEELKKVSTIPSV